MLYEVITSMKPPIGNQITAIHSSAVAPPANMPIPRPASASIPVPPQICDDATTTAAASRLIPMPMPIAAPIAAPIKILPDR